MPALTWLDAPPRSIAASRLLSQRSLSLTILVAPTLDSALVLITLGHRPRHLRQHHDPLRKHPFFTTIHPTCPCIRHRPSLSSPPSLVFRQRRALHRFLTHSLRSALLLSFFKSLRQRARLDPLVPFSPLPSLPQPVLDRYMSSLTTSLPLSTAYPPPPRPHTAQPQQQQQHHPALPRSTYAYPPTPQAQPQPYVFKTEPTTPPLQPYYSTPYSIPYSGPPQRPHTSHTYPTQRYVMSSPDRPSAGEQPQGYQQPMTPISGSDAHYSGPAPAAVAQFYGVASSGQHMPSPPPTSSGRPTSANFTPDGLPIVPVGISGGKMFRCKGFGECDKVFTRSEHLARHVR